MFSLLKDENLPLIKSMMDESLRQKEPQFFPTDASQYIPVARDLLNHAEQVWMEAKS